MTIEEFYRNYVVQLRKIYDEREAANIADWVFESITGMKRTDRAVNRMRQFDDLTIRQLNEALQQLMRHKPVQYVLGEAWFYKMKFFVNENVLIPRPETEELVEWVVQEFRILNSEFRILDVGTGSGCIAIALKKELPDADVFAIDVSEDALAVARKNAADLNAEINFLQLDFLDEQSWQSLPSFNIIVSNPPYIPANEKNKLNKNVVEHEPHVALFVEENDPFIFYKKIVAFAEQHLKQEGKIFVEVHKEYAKEVKQIFEAKQFSTEIKKDIYGKERMIKVELIYSS